MHRKIKRLKASVVCVTDAKECPEHVKDELEDTLLFMSALRGNVPTDAEFTCLEGRYRSLGVIRVWVYAYGYYVGRAKAMKAYKTKTWDQYYLDDVVNLGDYKLIK